MLQSQLKNNKLKTSATSYPIHIIMGLVLLGVSCDLLFHDHYFMWPPRADAYINSDFISAWGLCTGAGLIAVSLKKQIPIKLNLVLLVFASTFWGFETFMELMHSIIFCDSGRMLALFFEELGYLLLTFLMIRESPTRKRKDIKRTEQITIEKEWATILTSGVLGAIVSALISAWQWYLKYKDDRNDKDSRNSKNDVNFYRKKWLEDEDTIDQLRNEIRDLKDQVSRLKGKK